MDLDSPKRKIDQFRDLFAAQTALDRFADLDLAGG